MTLTLATLRARVRTTLENAAGFPDPLPVLTSSETAFTLRDRVELHLQDSTNLRWATGDIDEAIEKVVEEYNRHNPTLAVDTVTLGADGREVDISGLTDVLHVHKVWHPYDSANPSWPPNWVQFDVWPGEILFIDEPTEPASGDKVRVWYTTPCTLNLLNSATATTIPNEDITYLINGACYYAARQRQIELAEDLLVDRDVVDRLAEYADQQGKTFRYGLRQKAPAWQRYAYGYDQGDIDEGIRWALGRFNETAPDEAIGTITLAAAGREIALTTLTGLLRVTRAWWPYTAASPEYTPNWVRFEQWGAGSAGTLFLDTGSEPQAADVVRVWYEKLATINGLDSATATTLPDDAETLIVTGAVGWIAEERILEQPGRSVPRKLREWADARLRDFTRGLKDYARRKATGAAGITQLPTIDRWDTGNDQAW